MRYKIISLLIITTIFITISLSLYSVRYLFVDLKPVILPVQCYNDPYIDKLLDALRMEESVGGKYLLNINRDKNGKEISHDEGDYQLNSSNSIKFANAYNDGRRYNPYDKDVARRIARQLIIDNYKYSGNYFDACVMYNCGIGQWMKKAPYKSYLFASRIMRRIK